MSQLNQNLLVGVIGVVVGMVTMFMVCKAKKGALCVPCKESLVDAANAGDKVAQMKLQAMVEKGEFSDSKLPTFMSPFAAIFGLLVIVGIVSSASFLTQQSGVALPQQIQDLTTRPLGR